jgi:hypothetical protein
MRGQLGSEVEEACSGRTGLDVMIEDNDKLTRTN